MNGRNMLGLGSQVSARPGVGGAVFGSSSFTDPLLDRFGTQGNSQRSHGAAIPSATQTGWLSASQVPAGGSLLPLSQPTASAGYLRPSSASARTQPSQQLTLNSCWLQQQQQHHQQQPALEEPSQPSLLPKSVTALRSTSQLPARPSSAPMGRSRDRLQRPSSSLMHAPTASGMVDQQQAGQATAELGAVDSRDGAGVMKQLGILDNHLQDLLQQTSDHGSALQQQQRAMGQLDGTCSGIMEQLQAMASSMADLQQQLTSMQQQQTPPVVLCSVACQTSPHSSSKAQDFCQQTTPMPARGASAKQGPGGSRPQAGKQQQTPLKAAQALAGKTATPAAMQQQQQQPSAGVRQAPASASKFAAGAPAAGSAQLHSRVQSKQTSKQTSSKPSQQRSSQAAGAQLPKYVQGTLTFSRVHAGSGQRSGGSSSLLDNKQQSSKQMQQKALRITPPAAVMGSQRLSLGSNCNQRSGSPPPAAASVGGNNAEQHTEAAGAPCSSASPAAAPKASMWYSKRNSTTSAHPAAAAATAAAAVHVPMATPMAADTLGQGGHRQQPSRQKDPEQQHAAAAAASQRPRRATAGRPPQRLTDQPSAPRASKPRGATTRAAAASKRVAATPAAAGVKRSAPEPVPSAFTMLSLFADAPAEPACSCSNAAGGSVAQGHSEDDIAKQVAAAMAQHRQKRHKASPGCYEELSDL